LILFGVSVCGMTGQQRTFILSLSKFAAASIACGIAPNAATLVIFRGVHGAAGAFLIPASPALVGTALSGGALTTALDPPLGDGWLTSSDGVASSF
jgi:MFS family permease